MTTKLPYTPPYIDEYFNAEYLPDEPEQPIDGTQQTPTMIGVLHLLADRFTEFGGRQDVFLDTGNFIYYDPADRNVRVGPDIFIAFGVDVEAIRNRNGYLIWEVGKAPDFAMEIASPSTSRRDLVQKRAIYANLGITEYWRFDATGGQNYGEPMVGERLVDGDYERLPLSTTKDGIIWAHSPLLGLDFCYRDGHLLLYDPVAGEYLRKIDEERAAREAAETDLQQERAARQAAEAEIERLREQLRRLQDS